MSDATDGGPHAADYPLFHAESALLKDHQRVRLAPYFQTVSALDIDPAGSRIASGSYDHTIKLWDFNSMDSTFRPFRTFAPFEMFNVVDVQFSLSGDRLLVASCSPRPKVFDRNATELMHYSIGDMYVRDMKRTVGHVAALTKCCWHPSNHHMFMTSAADSTVRLWDSEEYRVQKQVIQLRGKNPAKRLKVSSCAFEPHGAWLAAGSEEGGLYVYGLAGPFHRPDSLLLTAHSGEITHVSVKGDGREIVTRSMDGSLKLFDCRQLKGAVATSPFVCTTHSESDLCHIQDKYILVGSTAKQGPGNTPQSARPSDSSTRPGAPSADRGALYFLDPADLSLKHCLETSQLEAVRVAFHPKLNEIVSGSVDGSVGVYYDQVYSKNGVLRCIGRSFQGRTEAFVDTEGDVLMPNAAIAEHKAKSIFHARQQKRRDPVDTKLPQTPPLDIHGVRVSYGLVQQMFSYQRIDNVRDVDPREALLGYADKAEAEPFWCGPAYSSTQPKPVFDMQEAPETEKPMTKKQRFEYIKKHNL